MPPLGNTPQTPVSRRQFLSWMASVTALLTTPGCIREPEEKIIPYARMPEEVIPGVPLVYATTMPLHGYGLGLTVESYTGRPTKIEGNERHPASLGATDAVAQNSLMTLYDPDRSAAVTRRGIISTWDAFQLEMRRALEGARRLALPIRILTPTLTSPTAASWIRRFHARFPSVRWHSYDPLGGDETRAAVRAAFGGNYSVRYDFTRADVVLSLDHDFLGWGPGKLRYARELMDRRRGGSDPAGWNRLYVAEPTPTLAGGVADHRLPAEPAAITALAYELARALGEAAPAAELSAGERRWITAAARDLQAHRGRSLVLVGPTQRPELQALGFALNARLGNLGTTITVAGPVEVNPTPHLRSLAELVQEMEAGVVEVLLVLGANPAADAPADVDFAGALRKVKLKVHHGLYADDTAALCDWHLPEAHYLESWGDCRAFDGTASLVQPLIQPLFQGRSAVEVLALCVEGVSRPGRELVREHWRRAFPGADFETQWRRWLHDGVIPDTRAEPVSAPARWPALPAAGARRRESLDVVLRPDPYLADGQFANNPWLQELPRPFTSLVWDNAVLMNPSLRKRLGLDAGAVVSVRLGGREVHGPVRDLPGQAENTLTLHLGYGRRRLGRIAEGVGFDVTPLRTRKSYWQGEGAVVRPLGLRRELAATQGHHRMEGRDLVRHADLAHFLKHPGFAKGHDPDGKAVQPLVPADPEKIPTGDPTPYQWGMSLDLNTCIGCNACVAACDRENNVPVVGPEQVSAGREMHWLRVDTYFGEGGEREISFQPVPCMHCETAPCELVCPVNATVHSATGLNQMVYNRCVGTRYCSNNCPYKVRRFNFYDYTQAVPLVQLSRNPNVTVRSRGVMEKCTYCTQRIQAATIRAEREGRPVRDGEVVTACQSACPTRTIVFGNLKDPGSEVSRRKALPLDYGLLTHLNTRPRTTYLGRLRNPNPALGEGEGEEKEKT